MRQGETTSWLNMLAKEGATLDTIIAGTCEREINLWDPEGRSERRSVRRAYWPSSEFFDEMGHQFCPGFGAEKGCWFTVWTKDRVYFPTSYDGAEGVESVPRDPCGEATRHV